LEDPRLLEARIFREDAHARREAMEASMQEFDTPYAALRERYYALSGAGIESALDWDRLPEFAPRVRYFIVAGDARDEGPIAEPRLLTWEETVREGERAFDRYPAQIDLALTQIRSREDAERYGFYVEPSGRVRGLIEAETATGWVPAITCSGCHGRFDGTTFQLGIPSEQLDLGALLAAPWPMGTIDVTSDGIDNPTRPSDLRPISRQARLHHTGNVMNGELARMVRIETLLITQHGERLRPSRTLVAAIALYFDALAETLPEPDLASRGGEIFARECARCHALPNLSGAFVSVAEVGTDPVATTGGQRGTSGYRAPSLLGVLDRRGLFHDGSAHDVRAVLQLDPSAHRGHRFGLSLTVEEREALITLLRGIP
jgi:hypothetical protein